MLWHVIEHQPARHIAMIQSVRSADEIAYEEELRALAEAGRLRLEVTITREGRDQWLGPRRRIDLGMLQSVLRSPQTDCVLCGPPPMIQDVSGLLVHAGIAPERIVRESFAS
jgi:ferredoxin-NADP reductase